MERSYKLKESKYLLIALMLIVTGCASSSDLEKRANNHSKAGIYYESIGQPNAAREEHNNAKENRDHANGVLPLLVELFNLFNKKDK